jgi:hypothetical protein
MFRSIRSTNRPYPLIALVCILAFAVIAAFMITHQQNPIPVTNAGSANSGVSAANPAVSHQKVDLGAGYWLETDAQGGRIIPPETMIKPADKTFDLGAGYRLVVTASGGQILPPARPSTYYKKTDLGAGYVLVETADTGQIVPPSSPVKIQSQAFTVQETYIGGGYWLVIGPDGGKVVPEGSR